MFPISYRDLELMLQDRGVEVDHTTIFRWIQAYAAELEKRLRPHLRMSNGSWRVDETYVKVKGRWIYLYRAVDSRGQTIDFLLSAKRDAEAAKRFFRKALAQPHTVNPRTITVDKNAAYPKATAEMKKDGELWRRSRLRQVKYLNNIVRPSERETVDPPGLGLRWLLDGPTNTVRLRGDGNVEERAGSEHQWQRHQGSGNIHRRTISSRRLRGELGPLADHPRPDAKRCNRTRRGDRRRAAGVHADRGRARGSTSSALWPGRLGWVLCAPCGPCRAGAPAAALKIAQVDAERLGDTRTGSPEKKQQAPIASSAWRSLIRRVDKGVEFPAGQMRRPSPNTWRGPSLPPHPRVRGSASQTRSGTL
jgi:transposase-like protein